MNSRVFDGHMASSAHVYLSRVVLALASLVFVGTLALVPPGASASGASDMRCASKWQWAQQNTGPSKQFKTQSQAKQWYMSQKDTEDVGNGSGSEPCTCSFKGTTPTCEGKSSGGQGGQPPEMPKPPQGGQGGGQGGQSASGACTADRNLKVDPATGLACTDNIATSTKDTTPPTIVPPGSQSFATTSIPAYPTLVQATASDDKDPSPVVTYEPHAFQFGTTTVTWTATDIAGNSSATTSQIGVYQGVSHPSNPLSVMWHAISTVFTPVTQAVDKTVTPLNMVTLNPVNATGMQVLGETGNTTISGDLQTGVQPAYSGFGGTGASTDMSSSGPVSSIVAGLQNALQKLLQLLPFTRQ